MFEGGIMACTARNHDDHASCVALAQNANGFVVSSELPNASNDGMACSLIAISSLSPSGGDDEKSGLSGQAKLPSLLSCQRLSKLQPCGTRTSLTSIERLACSVALPFY